MGSSVLENLRNIEMKSFRIFIVWIVPTVTKCKLYSFAYIFRVESKFDNTLDIKTVK